MTFRTRFILVVFAVLLAGQSWAHHNMTAVFDFNDRVTVSGTLTAIDWRNPHTYFTVEAKGANSAMETWQIEGPSPSFFRVREVGKADFEDSVGKMVTVEISRARDKSRSGLIRTFTLANGKVVSACPQNC
jgi:Family of unknown function (DUF6152)